MDSEINFKRSSSSHALGANGLHHPAPHLQPLQYYPCEGSGFTNYNLTHRKDETLFPVTLSIDLSHLTINRVSLCQVGLLGICKVT